MPMRLTAINLIINLIILMTAGNIYFLLLRVFRKKNWKYFNPSIFDLLLKVLMLYWITPFAWLPIMLFSSINRQEFPIPGEDGHIGWKYLFTPLDMAAGYRPLQIIIAILYAIWIAGLIFHLLCKVNGHRNIMKFIHVNSSKNLDQNWESRMRELIEKYHTKSSHTQHQILRIPGIVTIKKTPELYWCRIGVSAFVTGWLRPKIYLPVIDCTELEQEYILRHELAHCKRNDILFRYLLLALQIIYWFNPLMSIFAREFKESNEIACDELALQFSGSEIRKMYARMLVNILEKQSQNYNAVFFSDYNESNIQWRLTCIMKYRKKGYKILTVLLLIFCISFYPITVFAAAAGISAGEAWIAEKLMEINTISTDSIELNHEEVISYIYPENINANDILKNARGSNMVNSDLNGTELYYLAYVYLNAGDYVLYTLANVDNDGDFLAGIMDSHSKLRTVDSINGIINYTFRIDTSDYYYLLVQGLSSNSIHISGSYHIP